MKSRIVMTVLLSSLFLTNCAELFKDNKTQNLTDNKFNQEEAKPINSAGYAYSGPTEAGPTRCSDEECTGDEAYCCPGCNTDLQLSDATDPNGHPSKPLIRDRASGDLLTCRKGGPDCIYICGYLTSEEEVIEFELGQNISVTGEYVYDPTTWPYLPYVWVDSLNLQ